MNAKAIVAGVAALVGLIVIFTAFTIVDAKHIVVAQSVRDGHLTVITEPGPTLIWWAHTTTYPRRAQYAFNKGCKTEEPGAVAPKTVQFNDGGTAVICGVISWEMPLDPVHVIRLHKEFNSEQAIDRQLVNPAINTAMQVSGPTMNSTESVSEKKGELLRIIDDQVRNGTFETVVESTEVKDASTGQRKTVNVTKIIRDDKGQPKRIQGSSIVEFGIHLQPLSVAEINYDDKVKEQIGKRLDSQTAAQLSQANAIRAEQDAITAEQQGKAKAAEAKWAQEVIKATEVTKAQQGLAVAELRAKEAEQYKREQILRGEGEASRKKLVMDADGALDKKVEAYVRVNELWANAFGSYQGNLVSDVSVGGGNSNGAANAMSISDAFMVKMMKDLQLDLNSKKKQQ